MSNYREYNGTEYDYSQDEILDNDRLYNRKMGYMNPKWEDREEWEPEFNDPDCWD